MAVVYQIFTESMKILDKRVVLLYLAALVGW